MSFAYQWKRNGAAIAGATAQTYVLVAADIGASISGTVTATNTAALSTSVTSAAVGPVTSSSPVNTAVPVISGTPSQGNILTTSQGTWSNTPTAYAYQWTRAGANISGATASAYTLLAGDVGTNIAVIVTTSNAYGTASASAAAVGPITAPYASYASAFDFKQPQYRSGATLINNATLTEINGDPGFSTPAYWQTDAGVTVSGGKANFAAVAATFQVYKLGIANGGATYQVTFTIDSISAGGVRFNVAGALGTTRTAPGTYTETISGAGALNIALISVGASTTAVCDNFSIKAVGIAGLPGYGYTRSGAKSELGLASGINRYNLSGMADFSSTGVVTNHDIQSQSFNLRSALSATVTVDNFVAPDGTTTGDLIVASATGVCGVSVNRLQSVNTYTSSFYVSKTAGTAGFAWVQCNGSPNFALTINKTTGALAAVAGFTLPTAYAVDAGTCWRVVLVYTSTATNNDCYIGPADAAGDRAATAAKSIGVWQGQTLLGTFADGGPIVPTTTSARSIGTIEAFAANVPGIVSGIGYLSRGALTNQILNSQDITAANWTKNGTTAVFAAATAPDGTATASSVTETVATTVHNIVVNNADSGGAITWSIFLKADQPSGAQWVQLGGGLSTSYANFDLVNGVVGSSANVATTNIINCGNSWYRCVITLASFNGIDQRVNMLAANTASRDSSYLGTGRKIYVWQGQTLGGAVLPDGGPIIATTTAAASIGADALSMTNPVTSDQDFIVWGISNIKTAYSGSEEVIVQLGANYPNAIYLERAAAGALRGQVGTVTYDPTPTGVAGRAVIIYRRKAGKDTVWAKFNGTISTLAESGLTTFPTINASLFVGNAPINGTAEGAFIQLGTFTDAQITAILTAA